MCILWTILWTALIRHLQVLYTNLLPCGDTRRKTSADSGRLLLVEFNQSKFSEFCLGCNSQLSDPLFLSTQKKKNGITTPKPYLSLTNPMRWYSIRENSFLYICFSYVLQSIILIVCLFVVNEFFIINEFCLYSNLSGLTAPRFARTGLSATPKQVPVR
jgi:hypothetical protein